MAPLISRPLRVGQPDGVAGFEPPVGAGRTRAPAPAPPRAPARGPEGTPTGWRARSSSGNAPSHEPAADAPASTWICADCRGGGSGAFARCASFGDPGAEGESSPRRYSDCEVTRMTGVSRWWVAVGDCRPSGHDQRAAGVVRGGRGARSRAHRGGERREAGSGGQRSTAGQATLPTRGGSLVATLRSEPRTFNPHAGSDFASSLVISLTQARLAPHQPRHAGARALAGRVVACAPDGLSCTLKLPRASPSPTARRSRQPTWCSRSRRPTTRRPAARSATRCSSAASRSPSAAPDPRTVVGQVPVGVRSGPAPARLAADPPETQARGGAEGRRAPAAVGPRHAPRRHRRPRSVRARRRTSPASASSSCATRNTGARTRRARNCRISIA